MVGVEKSVSAESPSPLCPVQSYRTRDCDGGHPVRVYGGPGGERGSTYEVDRPDGVSTYGTVAELLRDVRGRETRWGFARYFRTGVWDPYASALDDGLSVLDLFSGERVRGGEGIHIAGPHVDASRVVAYGDTGLTTGPTTPGRVPGGPGINLSEKHGDVARLLFHRFGAMIRRSGYSEEDVLQEVYKGLIIRNGGPGAFNPERGTFGSYVSLVCLSVVSNFHRKENRRRRREPTGVKEYSDGQWAEVDVASSRHLTSKGDEHPGSNPLDDLARYITKAVYHRKDRQQVIAMASLMAEGADRKTISEVLAIRGAEYRRIRTLVEQCALGWAKSETIHKAAFRARLQEIEQARQVEAATRKQLAPHGHRAAAPARTP